MAAEDRTHQRTGRRRASGRELPRVPGPAAAAAVGLLLALLARVLILAGERGCDAVRGTATCGTAGGLMLLVIVALVVYLGARLLRTLRVPEAGVTSFLGVTLLILAVLTVLLDHIFSSWMWLVLPLVAALTYGFAAWAATTMAAMGDDRTG